MVLGSLETCVHSQACLRNLSMVTKAELFPPEQCAMPGESGCLGAEGKALNEPLAQTQQVSLDKDGDRALCQTTSLSWLELVSAGVLLSSNYHIQTKNS